MDIKKKFLKNICTTLVKTVRVNVALVKRGDPKTDHTKTGII